MTLQIRVVSILVLLGCGPSTSGRVEAVPVVVAPTRESVQERYRVVLERSLQPGQRLRVERRSRLRNTRRVIRGTALEELQETDQEVELTAVATVIENDDIGGVRVIEYVVERFVWLRGAPDLAAEGPILRPGAVVRLTRGLPGEFAVDGEVVYAGPVGDALRLALDSTTDEDQDALFGTSERQPVNGSWSASAEGIAAVLSQPHVAVDPDRVSGTVTLVEASEEAYRVRATWHVELDYPQRNMTRVVHGDGEVLYDADPAQPPRHATLELRQHIEFEGDAGTRTTSTSIGNYETRRTLLPANP